MARPDFRRLSGVGMPMIRREQLRKGQRVQHEMRGWIGTVKHPDCGTSLSQVFVIPDAEYQEYHHDRPGDYVWPQWVDHQDLVYVDAKGAYEYGEQVSHG
jgi:hypothetical protein